MIKSMTGFGSSKGLYCGFEISVELKSVNNKYLESNIRMPRNFLFAEEKIKEHIQKHITRGKVDVFINLVAKDIDDIKVSVNEPLLRGYLSALQLISNEYHLTNDISTINISKLPDVLNVEKADIDAEELTNSICNILESALSDFDEMRIREGSKLKNDILEKLAVIEQLLTEIENISPDTVDQYKIRLEQKMKDLLEPTDIDQSRLIQEVAIFADHIAIDEETVRLRSHISQLKIMIESGSPIGRKVDFLLQEFNREANTIGSKCQNSDIAHLVVDLKSEIEKIREQVQNIE